MSVMSTTSAFTLGQVLGIVILGLIVILLVYAALSLEKYRSIWSAVSFIISSLRFTAFGGIVSGIAYAIYLIGIVIGTAAGAIDPMIYGYGVIALIGFTIIGYAADWVFKRILQHHRAIVPRNDVELNQVKSGGDLKP